MLQWEQYWSMHPLPDYTAPYPEWRAGPGCRQTPDEIGALQTMKELEPLAVFQH